MLSARRKPLAAAFAFYLVVVAALTIVPTHVSRVRSRYPNPINLVPVVYSVTCFQLDSGAHPHITRFCLKNLLGNIALFLPLGILLPLVSDRFGSLRRVLLLGFCLSLSIETIQYLLRFVGTDRSVDIDDVLLNTLGACLGFVIYKAVNKRSQRSEVRDEISDRLKDQISN